MKTWRINHLAALVLVGFLLALPISISAEETAPLSTGLSQPVATTTITARSPAATPVPPPPAVAPIKLSSGAAGIAKLAQGGVDESVMIAYIGTMNGKFNLGSDQIVYLNDLGISSSVIQAMIQRDSAIDAIATVAANPPSPTQPPFDTNIVSTAPPPPFVDDPTLATAPDPNAYPVTDDSDYFYNSLSPYGAWVLVPGCGLCWRPTVGLGNRDWQPYADRGRWLYSDAGWYWQSDYSWGWAAFHYGRWFNDSRTGWCWQPNRNWGPAWVSWRRAGDYCGWAPLPPAARYSPTTGYTYANRPVGGNFDFGLRANQYKFVPVARLSDYNPTRYAATGDQASELYSHATVMNQITTKNNHIVNAGIDPREVAAASRTEIRRASIVETSRSGNVMPTEHLTKQGDSLVIVRPQLPMPTHPSVTPAPARLQRAPLYFKGSYSSQPAETYPRGSLVVVGPKTTSHAAINPIPVVYYASANVPTMSSQPARSTESFTIRPVFNPPSSRSYEPVTTQDGPLIGGGRYTVSQRLGTRSEASHFHNSNRKENENRNSAPVAPTVRTATVGSSSASFTPASHSSGGSYGSGFTASSSSSHH